MLQSDPSTLWVLFAGHGGQRDEGRVGPDGIGLRHVTYGLKGVGQGSLHGTDVLDHYC